MSQLKVKLYSAASVNAGLQALLGTSPFNWYDEQLPQNVAEAFPAITVLIVSDPRRYVMTGRLATSWSRVQFTIYGAGSDSANADAVAEALANFLDGFNAAGKSGLPANANYIVGDRDGGIAQTDPITYLRLIDALVYNNELV
jgi:hypothetical protein